MFIPFFYVITHYYSCPFQYSLKNNLATFAALRNVSRYCDRKAVLQTICKMNKGPISQFIQHHYRHFNAAALVDAAKGYEQHLLEGGKMMITLAGAMSTGELGISLAEMIRQGKVDIISCTGANLEEDVMNLVAHSHYKRIPNYRDLTPQQEWDLLENHYNRVTDTCIPEEEAFRDRKSVV